MNMRFSLILAITGLSVTASAQSRYSADLPNVIIKFSPQHLIRGGLWMSGELFNEKKQASNQIGIEMLYGKANPGNDKYGIYQTSGFTFEYAFKYYPNRLRVEKKLSGERIGGFYTGFFAQAGSVNQKVRYDRYTGFPPSNQKISNEIKTTSFYPGFILGKTQSLGESLYIDVFIGAGVRMANTTLKTDDGDYAFDDSPEVYGFYRNGVMPKIGFTLGIGI
ncbi:MAG: hypothetical protein JNL57_05220 [Bacteroidetes bacterium]|nr:hypothetical protein [Bacteroidota bacterium]